MHSVVRHNIDMKKILGIIVLGLLLSGCSNLKTVDQYGNEIDWDTAILAGEITVLQANKKSISILYDPVLVSDEALKILSNNHCKTINRAFKSELVSTSNEYNKKMKVFKCS